MTASGIGAQFEGIRRIGFDPIKREKVLKERNIDLGDMRFVLNGPYLIRQSDRDGEARYMVFGFLEDVEVVFICTIREDLCHVISARRARRDERKKYHSHLSR